MGDTLSTAEGELRILFSAKKGFKEGEIRNFLSDKQNQHLFQWMLRKGICLRQNENDLGGSSEMERK